MKPSMRRAEGSIEMLRMLRDFY